MKQHGLLEVQSSTIGTLEVIESNFTNSTRRGDKRDAQSEYEKQGLYETRPSTK